MGKLSAFTKALLAIILFMLLAMVAQAQTKFQPQYEWFFRPGDVSITDKGYVRVVIEPAANDTATYTYTILREKKQWYDTIRTETLYNDTHAAIVYSAGWDVGQGLPKFFNGDAHWKASTSTTVRTATFTITSDVLFDIRFYSEHFNESWGPHGKYTVSLDGKTPIEINAAAAPIGSDKDLGTPSWKVLRLPPGTHKVVISTSAQMVVDGFTIIKYTLKPR